MPVLILVDKYLPKIIEAYFWRLGKKAKNKEFLIFGDFIYCFSFSVVENKLFLLAAAKNKSYLITTKFVRQMKTAKNKRKLFSLSIFGLFWSFWLPKIVPFKKYPHFWQFFAIKMFHSPFHLVVHIAAGSKNTKYHKWG
jgi:hypothetical protein